MTAPPTPESRPRPAPVAPRGYAICTVPRSGSSYLAALLASTGKLGAPKEFLSTTPHQPNWAEDPRVQLQNVLRRGMTPNRIYGLKALAHQIERVRALRWSQVLPNLSFVSLERDDLLGQAVSHVRATQTKQWRSTRPAEGVTRYDRDAIMGALHRAAGDQARWRYWFARTGIEPLRLPYDEVVADPQGAVDAIAALVGLKEQATIRAEEVTLEVQRNAVSEAWRARFIRECGDPAERF